MRIKLLIVVALIGLLSAGCLVVTPVPTPTQPVPPTATPRPEPTPDPTLVSRAMFEEAACSVALPPGQMEGRTVECGYLIVPEDRSDPDSRDIRLAVAIFRHPGSTPEPDPIIYLTGGPGGSMLEIVSQTGFDSQFGWAFAAGRDIILFDQRGVGLSEPALECPAFNELYLDLLDFEVDGEPLSAQERLDRKAEVFMACAENLAEVADLSAYNTFASAADVHALRIALDYDQVNLWGASYGTFLALEVMRYFPEDVRSVVLEAPYPPEVDVYLEAPAGFDRALGLLMENCAADDTCRAAYPKLRTTLFDTVDRLNDQPAEVQVIHPFTRQRFDMLISGDVFLELIFRSLYASELRPLLPQIIYDASEWVFDSILLVAQQDLWRQEVRTWGMYFSVLCHDEIPFSSPEAFSAMLNEYPEFAGFFEGFEVGGLSYAVCPGWGAGRASARENEPVTSDIPTLILAGEYDPIAPPAWGRRVAQNLERVYVYEYPGTGHGVTSSSCPRSMLLAFLEDPTAAPDDGCIAEMEASPFVVPVEANTIELEPFTSPEKGVSGVAPAGWTEIGPGVFARTSSPVDQTLLTHEVLPTDAGTVRGLIANQFGLQEVPDSVGERQVNDLSWTLYETDVQGMSIDIALSEHRAVTFLVLLVSPVDERDALYDTVFLPAVDALISAE